MNTVRGNWTPAGRALLAALLLLGLLRLAHVVLHDPLAGFANQFDMLRITGCLGLAPDLAVAEGQATPAAPVAVYRSDAPFNSSCLPGSELLFAGLAVGIDRLADAIGLGTPGEFPLRLHALLKAALIVLAWLWLQRGLRRAPKLAIAHAATVALLLLDPFNTLYLAGFYTESSALIGAWLALVLPLTWLVRGSAPGWADGLAFAMALALLLGSRMQHVLLPLLWLGWLALWVGRQRWSRAPVLVPAVILLPLVLLGQILAGAGQPAIRAANTHNALFGAVLPAASDPLAMSRRLGLPEHCAELVHTTWYLRRGRDAEAECPQAFVESSRPQWVMALLAEPDSVARLVGRGIALSGQWRPAYLGELAGSEFARLPAGPLGIGLSVADGVARLPWWGLWWLWTLPAVLLIPVFWRSRHGERSETLAWLVPPLVIAVVAGWGVSLIGDGYSELARHLHLSANAGLLACGLLASALLRQRRVVGTAILLGVVLMGLIGVWVSRSAIAYGVADEPHDETSLAAGTVISGWALDPRGISAVRAKTDDGRSVDLELTPYPVLVGVFGAGVGGKGMRFAGVMLPGEAQGFELIVEPHHGEPTVIDRRFVR